MPIKDLLEELGVLPLRAIAFQSMLLLVAIALEGIVLRQRLRLGYRHAIQFAATLNLLAVSLGWLTFLGLEPLLPEPVRTQIMSYVLFNHFYYNELAYNLPLLIIGSGIATFFATLWLKIKGLEWLLKLLGMVPADEAAKVEPSRKERYQLARRGQQPKGTTPVRTLAVLEANALSFSAILLLLLLRSALEVA